MNTDGYIFSTVLANGKYNAAGQLTSADLAIDPGSQQPQIPLSRTYDDEGRPTGETDLGGPSQTLLYNYAVNYNANGDVSSFSDSAMGDWTVANDSKRRLKQGTASAGVYSGLEMTWGYDSFGNRTSQSLSGTTGALLPSPQTLTFTSNNRIAGLSYDAAGNVTDDGVNQYLYDGEGRLCASRSDLTQAMTGYVYDGPGYRVGKGTVTSFSCDLTQNGYAPTSVYTPSLDGEQLDEVDGNYDFVHTNVILDGKVLATYSGTSLSQSNWHYSLNDWEGTRRAQANFDGSAEGNFLTLPFGDNQTLTGDAGATENQFTGQERDAETGNDYFGSRYYASSMGRLLSPDPESPTPLHLLNPQRWNKYSYGLNNPLSFTDSGGRDAAAVNFSKEIVMVGHEGVMSVTSDGTVRYARFGPVGGNRLTGIGQVQSFALKTKIQFDSNGNPTTDSLNAVKQELSSSPSSPEQGQSPSSIRLNYFKTTPQETENLNQWIDQQQAASNQHQSPRYNVLTNNCADFCLRGLVAGDALTQSQANHMSFVPNILLDELDQLQSQEPKATVTTTECDTLPDESQNCY